MIVNDNSQVNNFDFVILGSGMVGLSIAYQLIKRNISKKICIIDKEMKIGLHSSGRNSGVLHAGLYYKPDSLKAKVCVKGSRRLKEWISERKLNINNCGKVIVPQKRELDKQLDLLASRGRINGAKVEFWDEKKLLEFIPSARTASGRALWSPNTSVVKPLEILNELKNELLELGVFFMLNQNNYEIYPDQSKINLENSHIINYGHLFNCTGLFADQIAHIFNIGLNYKIIPFKGLYWELNTNEKFQINTNLYPVPDLNVPFLGIHFTPDAHDRNKIYIGPTAIPAFGRENYRNFEGFDMKISFSNLKIIIEQFYKNNDRFRNYVYDQMLLALPALRLKSAQQLLPSIKMNDLKLSDKVGIRSQLFNLETRKLENDFICMDGKNSTHVLNAISPAFTASFELADLIINYSNNNKNYATKS